ncbi:four-carbon acid sugar kinase family protein [Paenibacillus xerothermodurans]|uniref:Four-carbon acid sugar kinase family protein n=1 Tax=Paenibacillus xerothermodurans TaxID=1977292 RepID=A0A2W1NIF7_PAEXE|nr:four-carbon acid sugar kinase family protein [Paenibacillus xerothermodurans]PZE19335.1 hypothetical protein CBW46_019190 [Paenibacillus xerothermodurans]
MNHIAIIADDLTGASDSGVQFARKCLATQVIFDLSYFAAETGDIDAVVVDTDSRADAPQDAYRRVRDTASQVYRAGFQHFYKKMDSTLRGNLGAEIDAVMDEIPFDFAVVAPAFPKIGRTTLHGVHSLNGLPIHQTEIAQDPKCPVKQSNLVDLFASQSRRKVGLIALDQLHSGPEAVFARINALLKEQIELIVFDAVTEDDMRQIAEMMATSDYKILWAGSAGIADYLPKALSLPSRSDTRHEMTLSGKPVLLAAGSISKVTRSQVAAFNLNSNVTAVELDAVRMISTEEGRLQEIARCQAVLLKALSRGSDVSLYASSSPEQVQLSKSAGADRGLDDTEVSNRIANTLGEIASSIVQQVQLQGVILTGGDTAKAVCRHLGVTGIQLLEEIEPGIPLGKLIGKMPLWVVTKAGAFGNEQSLLHAQHVLKGESSNE